jgi:hypothetical protein
MGFIGHDPFDIGEAVFNGAKLSAELRIFLTQELDAFQLFRRLAGIDGLAPAVFERITVLDPQPCGEDPAKRAM